ncbi:MAG: DNA-binding protein Alba [Candidatus Anstonellales archaeon]
MTTTQPTATQKPAQAPAPRQQKEDNSVYVGKKGIMGYVLAVVTQFSGTASTVTVKARGKLISRAVDVAEIVRNRFMPNVKISEVKISTEELTSEDGSKSKVSAIEIVLSK